MTRATYLPAVAVRASVILRGDPDAIEYPIPVVPLSCSVQLNSYRQADEFDLEFDCERFPFHTDDIRSLAITIYAFERASATDLDLDRYAIPANLLITGRCDEDSIKLGDDGRTFSCRGKDYTEVLTVRKWDPAKVVQVGAELPDVVQLLVDEAASADVKGRVLKVVYVAGPGEGVFARPWGAFSNVPRVRGDGTKTKGLTFPSGKNYWDVISDLCAMSGKRVFVRGLDVVISTPADLSAVAETGQSYEADGSIKQATPRGYRMAWGKNISELSITRKPGGERTPQQVVKCYDPVKRATLVGRWPEVVEKDDPEGEARFVSNVTSSDVLREMAKTAWHEISRGESVLEFKTADLDDMNGKGLIAMRPADPVWIEHDPLKRDELAAMGVQERYQRLIAADIDAPVASAIARNFDSLERWNRPYYTTRVVVDWDNESGMEITIGASSYLGRRAEKQLQTTPAPISKLRALDTFGRSTSVLR